MSRSCKARAMSFELFSRIACFTKNQGKEVLSALTLVKVVPLVSDATSVSYSVSARLGKSGESD